MSLRDFCLVLFTGVITTSVACAPSRPVAQPSPATLSSTPANGVPSVSTARILPRASGTPLMFCTSPGLSVELRLDSLIAHGTPIAMGTAELAAGASNTGTHRDADEAIYFLTAGGRAFVAKDTTLIEPGLMLWVPRGVVHGFLSAADQPVRFVWVNFPQALAQRFRQSGVTPGTPCPPARSP